MKGFRSVGRRVSVGVVFLAGALTALIAWLNLRDEVDVSRPRSLLTATASMIERGAYLARAGNCAACHTDRGGAAFAGGKATLTPFGTVYSSNLTPDVKTGIGAWSPDHFWRAMHNGRSKSGRLLYPAFPYPNFTQITREDSDALYAFLCSQRPVEQADRPHALRFPYNTQAALAVWRALFFQPGVFEARSDKSEEWNRGAYLVRGLGHCIACHSTRNAFGATSGNLELSGGLIPMQNWYAPSLVSAAEAGVATWDTQRIVDLLKSGTSPQGSVMGPMAEVVFRSTQHLTPADLLSMAVFLKDLPQAKVEAGEIPKPFPSVRSRGEKIYEDRCKDCHGAQGQGAAGAYPPLAGNRKVLMASPANLIRVVISGGFPPTTPGNPQPYGMPPFGQALNDAEIAAVVTYLRSSWGNRAPPVSELEVLRIR